MADEENVEFPGVDDPGPGPHYPTVVGVDPSTMFESLTCVVHPTEGPWIVVVGQDDDGKRASVAIPPEAARGLGEVVEAYAKVDAVWKSVMN